MHNSDWQQPVVAKGVDFTWLTERARDDATRQRLAQIAAWTDQVQHGHFQAEHTIFPLALGDDQVWLRTCDAWFSVIMYTEIMKEHDHLLVPGFDGRNAQVVVDLGANLGFYSWKMWQQNPACRIFAVEPNALAFEILGLNIQTNHLSTITPINVAIGPRSEPLTMRVVDQATALGGHYLGVIKREQRTWITESMMRSITVPCLSLADLFAQYDLDTVDILKMDVEEMELAILQQAEAVLPRIQRIVVEWHVPETRDLLIAFLESHDFRLIYAEPRAFADLYFIREA